MPILNITSQHITLAQALKIAGPAGTGGGAKFLVRSGEVSVNGVVETRPGVKLVPGDRFACGGDEWTVAAEK
jgi:ribosome-associated protein